MPRRARATPSTRLPKPKPRVGLALNLLDGCVGVSAGSFVAAGLANGMTPRQLSAAFIENDGPRSDIVRPNLFIRPALAEYARCLASLPGLAAMAGFGLIFKGRSLLASLEHLDRVVPTGLFSSRPLERPRAARQGAVLVLCLNPLVPFDATHAQRHRVLGEVAERIPHRVEGGLPVVLSQTFRSLIHSRLELGLKDTDNSHPGTEILLFEPDHRDAAMFLANTFGYAQRRRLDEVLDDLQSRLATQP